MSRQFQLVVAPDLEDAWFSALRGMGTVFVPEPQRSDTVTVRRDSMAPRDGEWSLRGYLCREGDVAAVVRRWVAEQGYFVIDALRSPVVEYSRVHANGPGRMCVQNGYYTEEGSWLEKDRSFLDWLDELFRWTKRHARRGVDGTYQALPVQGH